MKPSVEKLKLKHGWAVQHDPKHCSKSTKQWLEGRDAGLRADESKPGSESYLDAVE